MSIPANFDPIEYLASKGHHGKRGGTGEFSYACFFGCNEQPNSKKKKLYINARSGYFHCKVCEERGGTYLLLKHFGDEPTKDDDGQPVPARSQLLNQAAELGAIMLEQNDDLMLYLLNERGLTPQTIIDRQLGWVGGRWTLAGNLNADEEQLLTTGLVHREGPRKGQDFFYDHLLIPYQRRGRVMQMRGKVLGGNAAGRYMTGPGERVRLFNEDHASRQDVIVTEGEFDCMKLAQELGLASDDHVRQYGVVGLPGANAIPEDFEELLRDAGRVFIALDPDDVGRTAAVRIKDMLGARGRIVELPDIDGVKADWTWLLTEGDWTWRDAIGVLGDARGKRVFTIRDAYRSWRDSAAAAGEGLQTGYTELDDTISPGLVPGQLFVLLAKTGTGKTILLCNLAVNMLTNDVPVLFVSLEQTREEVYERLQRIYRFYHPIASDEDVNEALSSIGIVDQNRLSEKDIEELIEEAEVETGEKPQAVFVDYLGYFARGAKGGSPYEKVSSAVMALKAAAKRSRVVIIAPHQVNRMAKEGRPIDLDDARDSGVVEETADFLASIFRPDDGRSEDLNAQPTGKLRLQLLKSRHGGKDRAFTLQMDLLTLSIVNDNTAEAKEASEHNFMYWRGLKYEDLRRDQTKPTQLGIA